MSNRVKFRFHLRSGTTLTIKAEEVIVKYNDNGCVEWEATNADRWFTFLPRDLVAVERVKQ